MLNLLGFYQVEVFNQNFKDDIFYLTYDYYFLWQAPN